MKKQLLTLAFLPVLFAGIYGQAKPQPKPETQKDDTNQSELETFQGRSGSVIIKSYNNSGSITMRGGVLDFSVTELKDASAASLKIKGVLIELTPNDKYASSSRIFLEYKEIDGLLKGIEYIKKVDKTITVLENFEATYKTKDGLGLTVFNDSGNTLSLSVRVGRIGAKTVFAELVKLDEIYAIIQTAKTKLDELK